MSRRKSPWSGRKELSCKAAMATASCSHSRMDASCTCPRSLRVRYRRTGWLQAIASNCVRPRSETATGARSNGRSDALTRPNQAQRRRSNALCCVRLRRFCSVLLPVLLSSIKSELSRLRPQRHNPQAAAAGRLLRFLLRCFLRKPGTSWARLMRLLRMRWSSPIPTSS
jgi:hypothetical protein